VPAGVDLPDADSSVLHPGWRLAAGGQRVGVGDADSMSARDTFDLTVGAGYTTAGAS
jgi:hypothetical protein